MSAGRGTRRELSLSHEGHLDQWVEYAVLPYVPYHGKDCCWSEHCGPQYGCAPVEMREQVLRTYPATPAESAAARAAVGQ